MVTACAYKSSLRSIALDQIESENLAVETEGALKVAYLQMDVPYPGFRVNRIGTHFMSDASSSFECAENVTLNVIWAFQTNR